MENKNIVIEAQMHRHQRNHIRYTKFFFIILAFIFTYMMILITSSWYNNFIPYMFERGDGLIQLLLIISSIIIGFGFSALATVALTSTNRNMYYDEFHVESPSEVIKPKKFLVVKALHIYGKIEDVGEGKCKFIAGTRAITGEPGSQEFTVDKYKVRQDDFWLF